jgi:hypothetical protein
LNAFQQPSEEALCGFGVPPRLVEDVENDALLIHSAPQIVLHARDLDEHFAEVPLSPGRRRRSRFENVWPNFLH